VPRVVPYRFEDLVADLKAVVPYDWAGFLNQRLDSTSPHAPLGGVVEGGWQLAFVDSVPKLQKSLEEANKSVDLRYSIGMKLEETGRVLDVVPGRAAANAGIAPGVTLVAVNGRKFKRKVVREAIRAAATQRRAARAPGSRRRVLRRPQARLSRRRNAIRACGATRPSPIWCQRS
jgi:predicted metalloprotease with PDZ domain